MEDLKCIYYIGMSRKTVYSIEPILYTLLYVMTLHFAECCIARPLCIAVLFDEGYAEC